MPAVLLLAVLAAHGDEPIRVPGGAIFVEFVREPASLDREALTGWVRDSARAVAGFYGRFPVSRTRILVTPSGGPGVRGGRASAYDGGLIRVRVGAASTARDFANDWVLVHEMTHLALPSLPDAQVWLEEGLATYVEPLARAQAGTLGAEAVWAGFVDGMPKGLPRAGDRGLDRTHSWGRTYWGGALFCLVADIEIRRRTDNVHGLQHALRAILANGNLEESTTIESVLEAGDRAVGVPVLSELHARWKHAPVPVDLDALWHQLGVLPAGRTVRFDEKAPEAALRRAMTAIPGRR